MSTRWLYVMLTTIAACVFVGALFERYRPIEHYVNYVTTVSYPSYEKQRHLAFMPLLTVNVDIPELHLIDLIMCSTGSDSYTLVDSHHVVVFELTARLMSTDPSHMAQHEIPNSGDPLDIERWRKGVIDHVTAEGSQSVVQYRPRNFSWPVTDTLCYGAHSIVVHTPIFGFRRNIHRNGIAFWLIGAPRPSK